MKNTRTVTLTDIDPFLGMSSVQALVPPHNTLLQARLSSPVNTPYLGIAPNTNWHSSGSPPPPSADSLIARRLGKHTIRARDEISGRIETIHLSKETRNRYKDLGKTRRLPKPSSSRPISRPLTAERKAEVAAEYDEHVARLRELSKQMSDKDRLQRSLANQRDVQIAVPDEHESSNDEADDAQRWPDLPASLKFKKEKFVKRQADFSKILFATRDRFAQTSKEFLRHFDLKEECGNVTSDDERVLKNLCRLNTLADSYQGHYQGRLLVDHGKQLLRDCRALKGIDISKRKTRWPDIVKDIAQKGDLFKFVINPVYDD